MNLFDIPTGIALLAALTMFIGLVKLIGPRNGDADSLFRSPTDLGWPRDVQEEEPVRWRVELLGRAPMTEPGAQGRDPATARASTGRERTPTRADLRAG